MALDAGHFTVCHRGARGWSHRATTEELRQATTEFLRVALTRSRAVMQALVVGNEGDVYGLMQDAHHPHRLDRYTVRLRALRDIVVARAWL